MEKIKEILHFLLVGGNSIPEEHLLMIFTELADLSVLSGENDFDEVGVNFTTMFAENSLKLFLDAETDEDYDCWIEYYKELLLKNENYELLTFLDL